MTARWHGLQAERGRLLEERRGLADGVLQRTGSLLGQVHGLDRGIGKAARRHARDRRDIQRQEREYRDNLDQLAQGGIDPVISLCAVST